MQPNNFILCRELFQNIFAHKRVHTTKELKFTIKKTKVKVSIDTKQCYPKTKKNLLCHYSEEKLHTQTFELFQININTR